MKAKGEVTLFNSMPDGKAEELHTSVIEIQDNQINIGSTGEINVAAGGAVNIAGGKVSLSSGGEMEIASGAAFNLHATNGAEGDGQKHFGISSDKELMLFGGASAADGSGANFSVSKEGELVASNASIRGTVSVEGEMSFGEAATVRFEQEAARSAFFRALFANDVVPYLFGGTDASTREGAMQNFGLRIGSDVPTAKMGARIGDRYLLIRAGTTYQDTVLTPSLAGYSCTKTSRQTRVKTVKTYYRTAGTGSKSPVTTYTGWSNTGVITYGVVATEDSAYCYNEAGTSSGISNGATVTSDGGTISEGDSIFEIRVDKTTQYRTYTRKSYWAVFAAPVNASFSSPSVKSIIAALTRNATASVEYSLYSADSADGKEGRVLLASQTTGTTAISFNVTDAAEAFQAGVKYLCVERSNSTESDAVTVSAPSVTIKYFSGEKRTEEYAWNGVSWELLASANPYVRFPEYDYTDMAISATRTTGGEVTNLIDYTTNDGWYATYTSSITSVSITISIPAPLTQITLEMQNRNSTTYGPEAVSVELLAGGADGTLIGTKAIDLTENNIAKARCFVRMTNNSAADTMHITFTKQSLAAVGLRRIMIYGYLSESVGGALII